MEKVVLRGEGRGDGAAPLLPRPGRLPQVTPPAGPPAGPPDVCSEGVRVPGHGRPLHRAAAFRHRGHVQGDRLLHPHVFRALPRCGPHPGCREDSQVGRLHRGQRQVRQHQYGPGAGEGGRACAREGRQGGGLGHATERPPHAVMAEEFRAVPGAGDGILCARVQVHRFVRAPRHVRHEDHPREHPPEVHQDSRRGTAGPQGQPPKSVLQIHTIPTRDGVEAQGVQGDAVRPVLLPLPHFGTQEVRHLGLVAAIPVQRWRPHHLRRCAQKLP
mmetsp:Transcript_21335/g.52165  ORF Transcript_21335/g.52165 Transcript_21335/m.52165 type:complete len:272 (+) Transcript_21335:511-1326(+)